MNRLDQITYSPDYRSPPSGLGVVNYMGKRILIQDTGVCPEMPEGIYPTIFNLMSGSEDYNINAHSQLVDILSNLKVSHVFDPETAYDMPFNDGRIEGEMFTLESWDSVVREILDC